MGSRVYINGELVAREEAKISVFDHGLLYGDGVFEGIRSYNGLVFKLAEHIDRLYASSKAIMLEIPLTKEKMEKGVIETLKANDLKDAYIRLIVTRGEGDLGLDPKKCKDPTVIIITERIVFYPQKFYQDGLRIITVSTRRNSPAAVNPAIKSLNYLNNILAKIEAANSGVQEALMLSVDGFVTECTADNIFILKGKTLYTPPRYIGALPGITQSVVVDLAGEMGLTAKKEPFTLYDVYNSDEAFLTGTAAEVIPVISLDGRTIGDGIPGEITMEIMNRFKRLTRTHGVRIK